MNVGKPYPTVITPDVLAQHASVSDAEIEREITATARDLEDQRRKADTYLLTVNTASVSSNERRLAQFRADNSAYHIAQMKALLAFLRKLLAARAAAVSVSA